MKTVHGLDHKHILVAAYDLKNPPKTAEEVDVWLRRLVDLVGMKILMGPYSILCQTVGNEGVTGIVCIETSHASIHVWSECVKPFLRMDLYSCKDFDENQVIEMVREFKPYLIGFNVFDRNGLQADQKEGEAMYG